MIKSVQHQIDVNLDLNQAGLLRVFLCGDVMTGRGVDQVLPYPGDPTLYESCVRDAREYVKLAENANGPIPQPVSFKYIWGEALAELERAKVDLRIINLETSITSNDEPWPDKGIHYHMHPQNVGCLTAARISGCSLANNHVLDWGYEGLMETLQTLDRAGIAYAGAGHNAAEAMAPAVLEMKGKGRVLLFSFGSITSGIPREWGATSTRPGVNLLGDLSETTARRVAGRMRQFQQPGDLIIASIHWGGNWGYEVPKEQSAFAHRLIEEGVAIAHGHSSHHVKTIEVYQNHLILYGCGDFLTDYEGIRGYEMFRGDLALMYLIQVDHHSGRLESVRMVPMQTRRFQLNRASAVDARWLCDLLNQLGAPLGTHMQLTEDNSMNLIWQ
ncbi:MAG: poly-gamma-glutamate biosynthesis protein [Pedosphaera sp.]|nr:poly-gamma-glutamate biosynthesis protein [Pedosphaera sp.]